MLHRIVISSLILSFVTGLAYAYLADSTYPDLSCHLGYDSSGGKQDPEHTEILCANRTERYAGVCFKRCLLVQIGVLRQVTFKMRSVKEVASNFVHFAFKETPEGRWGALQLARNIDSNCRHIYDLVSTVSMNCYNWDTFFDCVDRVWKCDGGGD